MVESPRAEPITERAGMTDWVVAVRDRNPRGSVEANEWEVAKDRVGRNDRLGQGNGGCEVSVRSRMKAAKDRVGRNDRLSQGSGGKVE